MIASAADHRKSLPYAEFEAGGVNAGAANGNPRVLHPFALALAFPLISNMRMCDVVVGIRRRSTMNPWNSSERCPCRFC